MEQHPLLSSQSNYSGLNLLHSHQRNPKSSKKRSSRPLMSRRSSESRRSSSSGQRQRSRPPVQRSKSLNLTFIAVTFITVGSPPPAPLLWLGPRGIRSETTSFYCFFYNVTLHLQIGFYACLSYYATLISGKHNRS